MTTRGMTVALALALGGCMVGPDYRRPDVELPAGYRGAAEIGPAIVVPANWWALYGDATLEQLVKTGLAKNTDVRIAAARIEEAEAVLREAGAVLLPEIDLSGAGSRSRLSNRTATGPASPRLRNNVQISAGTAFELDFWGRLRRLQEAARAQYLASRYGRDVVALSLAAGIAQTYFAIRSLDAQIAASTETLKAATDSADIATKRAQAGLVSDLDVHQAEASRAQFASQLKELQRLRAVAVNQLGVLTATPDLEVKAGDLSKLPTPPLPPAGLPSTLLERRPDVRQAEAATISANALIGVARADQFPTLSLTASAGSQSKAFSDLFSSGSGIGSVGLNLIGPVIDWGRYAARTDQAEAQARQAALAYEQAVRNAFREVADALSNVRLAADAEQDYRNRLERAQQALKLATQRYESGYSAYLEVLDAQRTLNAAQLAFAVNRQAFLSYTVDLMNALGGGWEPY